MITILYIAGAVVILTSLVTGLLSGSFMGFLFAGLGGAASGVLFFALASIMDKQDVILYRLGKQEELLQKLRKPATNVCKKCSYEYSEDLGSCPNCGSRGQDI